LRQTEPDWSSAKLLTADEAWRVAAKIPQANTETLTQHEGGNIRDGG
jgi:hypothetical protein